MTVPSTNNVASYDGNDSATTFAYGFRIFEDSDLEVILTDSAGIESTLTLGSDYSVSGAGQIGGGSVTYPLSGSPLATGEQLTIKRKVPITQDTDLRNQGGFYPEVHEDFFDRAAMWAQDLQEQVDRSVKVQISSDDEPDELIDSIKTSEANAASSASDASDSADAAAATAAALNGIYYGELASDPSADPNGDPPGAGDLYFNTTDDVLRVYTGGAWTNAAGGFQRTERTLSAGQTTISGLTYTPGAIAAHLNGVLLQTTDYTATDGSTLTLNTAANDGDVFVLLAGIDQISATAASTSYDNATSGLTANDVQAAIDEQVGRTGNAGPLSGFRNAIINGDFRINQRSFGGDWSTLSNGDYGYDRWARKDASTISQVVEAGNFKPSTTYTLSGVNVTTQQLTSPASGDWQIDVPNTANEVQLEEGSVATPFERRPVGTEVALCQRYYVGATDIGFNAGASSAVEGEVGGYVTFPVSMRTTPALQQTASSNIGVSSTPQSQVISRNGFEPFRSVTSTGRVGWRETFTADAEFAITL